VGYWRVFGFWCRPRRGTNRVGETAAQVGRGTPGEQMRKFSQYPDFRGPRVFTCRMQEDRTVFKGLIQMIGIKAQ